MQTSLSGQPRNEREKRWLTTSAWEEWILTLLKDCLLSDVKTLADWLGTISSLTQAKDKNPED